jgi:hypothetical protein
MSLSIETSFFLIQYPSHVTFQNKIYIENFFIDYANKHFRWFEIRPRHGLVHVSFQNKIYIENFFIDLVKNISEIFWDMYFFPVFHSV